MEKDIWKETLVPNYVIPRHPCILPYRIFVTGNGMVVHRKRHSGWSHNETLRDAFTIEPRHFDCFTPKDYTKYTSLLFRDVSGRNFGCSPVNQSGSHPWHLWWKIDTGLFQTTLPVDGRAVEESDIRISIDYAAFYTHVSRPISIRFDKKYTTLTMKHRPSQMMCGAMSCFVSLSFSIRTKSPSWNDLGRAQI